MPFPSALSGGQYTTVRANSYKSAQYLSLCPNTVVFQALVNQASFSASFASVTYDTVTVGAYTAIEEGQTVLIGATTDIRKAAFIGRARRGPGGNVANSTVLNINETSAAIQNNWVITVIDDYRLYHELGRVSGGAYYKDYALTFSQLKPVIYNLQAGYAGWISGSPEGFTVSFSASALAAASGATISSYQYTTPDGTVTAGSLSSANVTIRFPAGFRWVKLVVTDSGGRWQSRYIPVWAHSMAYLPALGFGGATINGDVDTGWSATVDAFSGVDTVADNTLACIWNREYYDDVETNIISNVEFVGRLRKENGQSTADERYSLLQKVTFEIEGPMAQLARISAPSITMRDTTTPGVWDEIKNLTPWRAVVYMLEHSTFHMLYSLSFGDTSNTYRAFQLESAQGTAMNAVQDIANSINAVLEWTPQGEARMVRDAIFLDDDDRNALPTIANWTLEDLSVINIEREHVETVGLVEGDGGTYAPTGGGVVSTAVTPQLAIAPGVAQGNAEGTAQLTGQILPADVSAAVAQTELNTRLGRKYAKDNPAERFNPDVLNRLHWMIPSVAQWYTWTVAADKNPRGLAYTTAERWLLKSISITHDNDIGDKTVTAQFVAETWGAPGQTQAYPPPGTVDPAVPVIPPIQPYPHSPMLPDIVLPDDPDVNDLPPGWGLPPAVTAPPIPLTGDATAIASADGVWTTRKFLTVPNWVAVTPADLTGTVRDLRLVGQTAYLLTSDGSMSYLYYTADIFAGSNPWGTPTEIEGEYTQLEPASTAGHVYIKRAITAATDLVITWDLTSDDQGGVIPPPAGTASVVGFGSFTANGLECSASANGSGDYFAAAGWTPGFADVQGIKVWLSVDGVNTVVLTNDLTQSIGDGLNAPDSTGEDEFGFWRYWYVGDFKYQWLTADLYSDERSQRYWIPRIEWTVFLPADSVVTRFSSDYGASFGTLEIAGDAPSDPVGLTSIPIGTVALLGIDGQVMKTTSGGAWANYGSALPATCVPTCLVIPRYQFSSTSTGNTGSNPQYLVASSVEDGSGETIYKVTSSGTVFTAITPAVSGDKGKAIGPYSVWMPWWSGSIIVAVLMFGSSPRLVISTNAGSSWTDKGILDDDAVMATFRKGDKTMQQLFLTNGTPAYSKNRGTSIVSKAFPSDAATDPVIMVQPYG